jgi:hypothetical protein
MFHRIGLSVLSVAMTSRNSRYPAFQETFMKNEKEMALKATKEIVVKLIEVGRLSVSSFDETWDHIFGTIESSLHKAPKGDKGNNP